MENTINEIRKANDIVDVISSYLPLTKRGKITSEFAHFTMTQIPVWAFPKTNKSINVSHVVQAVT